MPLYHNSTMPTQTFNHEQTGILSCPPEIHWMVLWCCPDLKTLLAASHSTRALYYALKSYPFPIIESLVHQAVGEAALPDCIRAMRAKTMAHGGPRSERMETMVQELFENDGVVRTDFWSIPRGLAAISLREIFVQLAAEIGSEYATNWTSVYPMISHNPPVPPSEAELGRIVSALYRFETFCTIFARVLRLGQPDLDAAYKLFFSRFAPWEIEQIVSVFESVGSLVIPAFNDVALHDIEFGFKHVYSADSAHCAHLQRVLGHGLRLAYQLWKAQTYNQRYSLLKDLCADGRCFWDYPLSDFNESIRDEINSGITYPPLPDDDPECGAKHMWQWANQPRPNVRIAGLLKNQNVRRIGYVFWSRSRVDSSHVTDTP
ncbi:hypothetical protein VHEMI10156 [[Torrubiella] hemipterigena]|uniref:Uncharacterized protein n=1 Tax=[Torrubiella] hemipterigena TaxID=1531966 RepID=A0A0A1TSV1_9HYPO|nr:hypothetical protein VHEMI10156 [[Torrubiella] hemipterigena]